MNVDLKHNYIKIKQSAAKAAAVPDSESSYGGSQLWFDGDLRLCGCGIIAAADVLLYLSRKNDAAAAEAICSHDVITSPEPAAVCASVITDDDASSAVSVASAAGSDAGAGAAADAISRGDSSCDPAYSPASFDSPVPYDQYIRYIRRISYAFPMIPHKGMPGALLAFYLNIYFHIRHMHYRAGWITGQRTASITGQLAGCSKAQHTGKSVNHNTEQKARKLACQSAGKLCLSDRLKAQLADDIPVILCVGPGVRQLLEDSIKLHNAASSASSIKHKRGLTLYTEKAGVYTPAKLIRSHFVVVTAIHGDYAAVSSWGSRYYIKLSELEDYSRRDMFGLFTNMVHIRHIS